MLAQIWSYLVHKKPTISQRFANVAQRSHAAWEFLLNLSHNYDRGSISGRDRPKSLKQVVSAPLLNARHQVWVSQFLGDDHYKGLARVTVQNFQPFTVIGTFFFNWQQYASVLLGFRIPCIFTDLIYANNYTIAKYCTLQRTRKKRIIKFTYRLKHVMPSTLIKLMSSWDNLRVKLHVSL